MEVMLAAEAAAVMAALAEVVVEAAGAVPVAESGGTCGGDRIAGQAQYDLPPFVQGAGGEGGRLPWLHVHPPEVDFGPKLGHQHLPNSMRHETVKLKVKTAFVTF